MNRTEADAIFDYLLVTIKGQERRLDRGKLTRFGRVTLFRTYSINLANLIGLASR